MTYHADYAYTLAEYSGSHSIRVAAHTPTIARVDCPRVGGEHMLLTSLLLFILAVWGTGERYVISATAPLRCLKGLTHTVHQSLLIPTWGLSKNKKRSSKKHPRSCTMSHRQSTPQERKY